MRKVKSTLRRMRPIARLIAEEGNALDMQSRRLHRLADKVNTAEIDQSALQAMMVEYTGPAPLEEGEEWPCPNHDKFTLVCPPYHSAWKDSGLFKLQSPQSYGQPSQLDGRVG